MKASELAQIILDEPVPLKTLTPCNSALMRKRLPVMLNISEGNK